MKISSVESFLISVPYRHGGAMPTGDVSPWSTMDTLFVRVETDEGLTGWGEGFGFGGCRATMNALSTLVEPLCVGRDPTDIPALMGDLRRRLHNFGRDGQVMFALASLDIALWDIAGKAAGMPLYRQLGGEATAEAIPAYASLLRYGDPDLVARNCEEARSRGYRQVKLHEITPEAVAAARRAVGEGTPLMVDTNCCWSAPEAVEAVRSLRPYDLTWLEEPVWPPNDYEGLAEVRRESQVPVAAGENAGTLDDFAHLIDRAAVDYVQPSVNKVGGITEMRKILALAATRGVRVAPHSAYFGPGLLATIHLAAAQQEPPLVERIYCDLEASPLGDSVDAHDGSMRVPQGPGLGVEVDEKLIARYRVA